MKCDVYSRVCGYSRPVRLWNRGKQQEFEDRKLYDVNKQSEPHTHTPK